MLQRWNCEVCNSKGEVDIPKGTDLMSAVYMIEDAHLAVSPDCRNHVYSIRVERAEKIKTPRWILKPSETPSSTH